MCKSCKTKCDDIMEHMKNVHKFTEGIMKAQLKTNPNTFKNCFEVVDQLFEIRNNVKESSGSKGIVFVLTQRKDRQVRN